MTDGSNTHQQQDLTSAPTGTKKMGKQTKQIKKTKVTKATKATKPVKATKETKSSSKTTKANKSGKKNSDVKSKSPKLMNKDGSSPKKRGRKPKNHSVPKNEANISVDEQSYSVVEKNEQVSPSENIILHLPVHSDEINKETTMNDFPQGTNTTGLNNNESFVNDGGMSYTNDCFSEYPFNKKQLSEKNSGHASKSPIKKQYHINTDKMIHHTENWHSNEMNTMVDSPKTFQRLFETLMDDRWRALSTENSVEYNKKVYVLMKQFINESQEQRLPESTPIYCFWCCHPFQTQPFSLPLYKKDGVYHTYGNFCCPECCVAYNFNDFQDHKNQWERYTLIHELYRKVFQDPQLTIKPAPPRQCLTIFGGPLSINQFREKCHSRNKNYTLRFPPISSITVQQDEIDIDMAPNKTGGDVFIPVDPERITEANNNLKLKRTKPHNNTKNTLESCMKLEFFPTK